MRVRRSVGRVGLIAAAVAWATVAGACTKPAQKPPPTTSTTVTTTPTGPGATVTATGTEARSSVAREAVPAGAAGPAVNAVNALGASLYHGIAADNRGKNLVFSPLSIETALAMVRNGADGETRDEMDRVLNAAKGDTLDRALNALDTALVSHNGPVGAPPVTGEVGLRTSNALWAQDGFVLYAAFLDVLARHYGAGVNVVDFAKATEAARTRINAYVAGQTNDRIKELLPPGILDNETRTVLTNTVWFKAPWQTVLLNQGDMPFNLSGGSTVAVPTMSTPPGLPSTPGGYGEGPGWKAAELPYLGGALSMVVIVPDDLAAFEAGLTGAQLTSVTGGLHGELQSIRMPRWRTRTAAALPEQLGALGMRRAFTDSAQFPKLSPEPTRIDDVLHQAYIAVDEKGTEAAAATAIVSAPTALPVPRGTPLVVDRPFLYAIRDVDTGAVLFLGRVLDPSKVDQ